MSLSGAITLGSAAVGAYAAFRGAQAADDAADSQSAAVQLQRRQQEIANARQRRAIIRERRITQAANQARGVAQGMVGSSSLSGIQGALNTSLASNLNFLEVSNALTSQRASFLDQASQSSADATNFGALSKLGFTSAGASFNIFRQSEAGREFIANL